MKQAETEDTRGRIIDLVEALIMERGFNAISYQDVSDAIGIRKASVHYYFPSKADLGVAVIQRYIAKLDAVAIPIKEIPAAQYSTAFETFLEMFAEVARRRRVCLGGVLGAEYETLPDSMKTEVRLFYTKAHAWLAALLAAGRKVHVFRFNDKAGDVASTILAMLEGALIITRALSDATQLKASLSSARQLAGASPKE